MQITFTISHTFLTMTRHFFSRYFENDGKFFIDQCNLQLIGTSRYFSQSNDSKCFRHFSCFETTGSSCNNHCKLISTLISFKSEQWFSIFFQMLRNNGKFLYVITGSHIDFASHVASHAIGPDWKDLFDIIIFFARKPSFFVEKRFENRFENRTRDAQRCLITNLFNKICFSFSHV